jgi:hypothetical protein
MKSTLFAGLFVVAVGACASLGISGKSGVPDDAICAWVDWGGFKAWICASPPELARVQAEASQVRKSKGLP